MDFGTSLGLVVAAVVGLILFGALVTFIKCYRKVDQGTALVRTGVGGARVSFSGIFVIPILHRAELMDISIKRIEISRQGKDGLICQDNMRADIKVAFFVKVNKTVEDVLKVAQSLGCKRATDHNAMVELFDAKFSEALKTVGKRFDFVGLYNSRESFKGEILQIIGTDLNGYLLDDAAIDYLEQTPINLLNADNILDAEGIKKITDLTAKQKVLANQIDRDREKTIKQQDVAAREAILELERQQIEAEEKTKREILSTRAREEAETKKIQEEERRRYEQARIAAEEEIQISNENKDRQVIVARKNKERTEAIESERIEKDRQLEENERERVVELARIEKERALEEERRNIQEVIRERVSVEKSVVEEQEKIEDTKVVAKAEREKQATMIAAEARAKEAVIAQVNAAEASKRAAELKAEQDVIEAEAARRAADKNAEARKLIAEAKAAEEAALGISEANVMEAKAHATALHGKAEASVLEEKALAEAKGITAKSEALAKQGEVEANIMRQKAEADAEGLHKKAAAMKELSDAGRGHEEFKLRLAQEKEIQMAEIQANIELARAQAEVIREGLKTAKIDIVGGESTFFERIVGAVTRGKSVDRIVNNSEVLTDIKDTFFNGDPDNFKTQLHGFASRFGVSSEDLKNLTTSALIAKLMSKVDDGASKGLLDQMLGWAEKMGISEKPLKNGE